jgi:hypothetical protein
MGVKCYADRSASSFGPLWALLIASCLVLHGCGVGSEDTPEIGREVRPVDWHVFKRSAETVKIVASVPYCRGDSRPRIARVHISEGSGKTVIAALGSFPIRKRSDKRGCLGLILPIYKSIRLARPSAQLYDGFTTRPSPEA